MSAFGVALIRQYYNEIAHNIALDTFFSKKQYKLFRLVNREIAFGRKKLIFNKI